MRNKVSEIRPDLTDKTTYQSVNGRLGTYSFWEQDAKAFYAYCDSPQPNDWWDRYVRVNELEIVTNV